MSQGRHILTAAEPVSSYGFAPSEALAKEPHRTVTTGSDMFMLGVTLYTFLCGDVPYSPRSRGAASLLCNTNLEYAKWPENLTILPTVRHLVDVRYWHALDSCLYVLWASALPAYVLLTCQFCARPFGQARPICMPALLM